MQENMIYFVSKRKQLQSYHYRYIVLRIEKINEPLISWSIY